MQIEEKNKLNMKTMVVIGKFFRSTYDFINIMKVNKKYQSFVDMYSYNPIRDCSLFKNMYIQHIYCKSDYRNKRVGMKQYIYWYTFSFSKFMERKHNEKFESVIINYKQISYELRNIILRKSGKCVIPEGVTSIGEECFSECTSLTSIQLPSSLINIGERAFSHTNISTITIPEGVTSIGENCFYQCTSLTSVQLPSTLRSIGKSAFYHTNISTITIPEGVTSIGEICFWGCSSLISVQLPSSLISIGDEAFYHTNISTITIPE